jgi:site-specific recombinase XerD
LEDNLVITKNINDLETEATSVFLSLGYAQNTIKANSVTVRNLIRLHNEQGEEHFNKDIADSYVAYQEKRYENNEISRKMFLRLRIVTEYLAQINDTGTIVRKQSSPLPLLSDSFERILMDILANEEWGVKFKKHLRSSAGTFFRWLYSHGYNDLKCVDERIVREYLVDCSVRMVGSSLNSTRRALKNLLLFTSEDGILSEEMNRLFLFRARIDERLVPFMPQNEIAAVLDVIDRNSMQGKRDYAMILLATVTGMRGIDIVQLTLDSIDWRNGEIRIIQEKTDRALALPLTTDVGKAIREYVLNERPNSKSDKVFLSVKAPFGSIQTVALYYALKKYRIKVGLTAKRGVHSLRRSLATNMVTSGVSVITIAQALGHKTIESTKQYISLDSQNLKRCALDFSGIPIGGGNS